VIDGDTLRVRRPGGIETVRLAAVDTEERISGRPLVSDSKPGTVFGEETARMLRELVASFAPGGEPVRVGLRFPPWGEERDRYGRLLAHVVLPDGRDLSELLVAGGWSPYFDKYGRSPLLHRELARAEAGARRARIGIWDPRTNRPRTPGAPGALRPYERLLPWWRARAEAVEGFRRRARGARRAGEPPLVAADDEAGLRALLEAGSGPPEVEVFGALRRLAEEPDGSWSIAFEAGPGGLRARVAAERCPELERVLDVRAACAEFHPNHVYVRGRLGRDGDGFVLAADDPAGWRPAR